MVKKVILTIFLMYSIALAESHGQLSTIGGISKDSKGYTSQLGLQYIPTWSLTVPWPTAIFDTEIAFDIHTTYQQMPGLDQEIDFEIKPYRMWFRRTTDKIELRMGLQKITFGNARIFRSLMWFDRIDPTDPLQLTEGVWGIRARRDFTNNTNIWFWALLWNEDTKGWESMPTKKNNLEFGGRYQMPLLSGELGFSAHNRIISRKDLPSYYNVTTMSKSTPEIRGAIDGYFDIGIGLWFESTLVYADYGADHPNWQSFLTVGADYTLGIGNGLTITGEHFGYNMADNPFTADGATNMSGLILTYPVSIFDNLTAYLFYSWDRNLSYYYLSWQRSYDNWLFLINTYFSSDTESSFSFNQASSDFGNRGIRLMLIYNH